MVAGNRREAFNLKDGLFKKVLARIVILFAWICWGFAFYLLVFADRYFLGSACLIIGFIPYLVFNQFR